MKNLLTADKIPLKNKHSTGGLMPRRRVFDILKPRFLGNLNFKNFKIFNKFSFYSFLEDDFALFG